ncbi:reverse transcriptase domain-containing protein [Trichonephila clavata]|uniref:Reverse transcriptase domain-containing protein n=1 Tax=Trichonephila clavata TaxID=2740835 RepID=A0A8X6ISB0_TRICU|nr:reverse transcriptase domain-containing protein [Trichonephila clavata]
MNLRSQLMGDLPPIRFQHIRPFESTGMDFDGPITTKCAHKRRIEWSFIPPYTPHFGGLLESAIKSAKQLLIRATNSVHLNFEGCSTLLIQIEACLNSRPLTELSPDHRIREAFVNLLGFYGSMTRRKQQRPIHLENPEEGASSLQNADMNSHENQNSLGEDEMIQLGTDPPHLPPPPMRLSVALKLKSVKSL